jgi:mono/diheme cytochrome c family protein
MFSHKRIALAVSAALLLGACAADRTQMQASLPTERPNLGVAATPEEIKAWDISIPPSGAGLPPGSGTAKQGLAVYTAKCQACHGEKGVRGPADALAGGIGTLASGKAVRTVGSYWPYATTLWDYTRRAMPVNAPMSLSNDETYAVTAYMLALNGIVGEGDVINSQTLPAVKMPNRDGFISDWPPQKH